MLAKAVSILSTEFFQKCMHMQSYKMKITVLSAAVLAACTASVCTAQEGATFLLPPKVLQVNGTEQSCPSNEAQQRARNEISTEIQAYLQLLTNPGTSEGSAAESCQQIAQFHPNATSDYYWIRTANGSTTQLYCEMSARCGQPGWTRVAFINMSDSSQSCPSELAERNYTGGVRVCQRRANRACNSVNFSVPVSYSNVCGRVIGYQIGTNDAFCPFQQSCHYRDVLKISTSPRAYTIDDVYVDGLSLTHGNPREHIWTFAVAFSDADGQPHPEYVCPCTHTDSSGIVIPSFVRSNYFCNTGNHIESYNGNLFHGNDPLWDGEGCRGTDTCCSFNTPPWFMNQLSGPTTDPLELRSCGDQPIGDENVGIQLVEIYVQ